jgi:ribonuclease Z
MAVRKLTLAVLGLLIAGGIGAYAGRTAIAERLYLRALDQSVGIDQSVKLGDGLHAYVCGSGSPLADAERAGPCIAVLAGRDAFVFDSGSGSTRKLLRMGFPAERMRGIFLTHLHSDHIDGLGELLLQVWVGGSRGTPIPVYGPPGTERVLAGLREAYELDAGYRVGHHGAEFARPGGFGGTAQILTVPNGPPGTAVAYDQGGVKITVIRVDHSPIEPAYGYRIDYEGRSISISGDTIYSPEFVAAAKGTDVMFHEALNPTMVRQLQAKLAERGRRDAAKIIGDIPGYHASPADAARSAQEAGAGALVYYHVVPSIPAGPMEGLFLGDAAKRYKGLMKVGNDGLLISLPAKGQEITFDQRL